LGQRKNKSEDGRVQAPTSPIITMQLAGKFRISQNSGTSARGNLADEKAHRMGIPDENLCGFLPLGIAQFPAAKADKGGTGLIIKGFRGSALHFGRELIGEGFKDFEDVIHGI
jgi:hypothetical protein